MVVSLVGLLLVASLVITLVHAVGKAPLWPAVLLIIVVGLLGVLR
jgi:hypothetical protein